MADTAARLALVVRRYEVARFTIAVRGIDLTGVMMAMQVRLQRGTPGAPLIALGTVTTTAAEGLKLDSVTVIDGVPVSIIKGRINQSTMSDAAKVPYAGELGDDTTLAYAMQWTLGGDAQTRIEGDLIVRDSAFGSDNAPAGRPAGYGAQQVASGGSGTLTFGDQVIAVSIDGLDVIAPFTARSEAAADTAETAAQQATAAAAAMVPLCTATVTSNDASATVYAIATPAGFNAGVDGQRFSFVVPATALGAAVRLNVSGAGQRDAFFAVGRTLRAGWIATFSANNAGSRWNFETQVPNDLALTDTEVETDAAYSMVSAITGAQIAKAIGGNPNELFVPTAPLTDSYRFTALVTTSPTGPLFITNGNGERRSVIDAGGAQIPAGTIIAPAIISAQFSGGYGNFIYTGSTPVPTLPALQALASAASPSIWKVLDAAVSAPYGSVAKGSGNRPVFTPTTINILGRGSSVSTAADDAQGQPGRAGGCPRDHVPVWLLRDAINDKFGPGINAVAWNYSHGGHVASQAPSQWDDAIAAGMPAVPEIVFDCFGMNDLSPYSYNSGQVTPTFIPGGYYDEIRSRLDAGVKLFIIATTPHENTERYSYTLDGVPMIWPYGLPVGVQPDQMVPPAAQSVLTRDWTGSGIRRPGSARAQHTNTLLRDVVRRFNADPAYRGRVVLCDAGWSWFRNGVEQHTLTELYGQQEIVHPIELGHAVSYDPCIREIADAMQRGQSDKWWFRGEDAFRGASA